MNLNSWREAINEDPLNWDLRRICADWLEENGYLHLAQSQRFMANKHITYHHMFACEKCNNKIHSPLEICINKYK